MASANCFASGVDHCLSWSLLAAVTDNNLELWVARRHAWLCGNRPCKQLRVARDTIDLILTSSRSTSEYYFINTGELDRVCV